MDAVLNALALRRDARPVAIAGSVLSVALVTAAIFALKLVIPVLGLGALDVLAVVAAGLVLLRAVFGGTRVVDKATGDPLSRIC
jgi:hypothetical protein